MSGSQSFSRRRLLKGAGAMWLLSVSQVGMAATSQVVAVRVWPASSYTRVTVESNRELKYRQFALSNPERLVVDLEGVNLNSVLKGMTAQIRADDPFIKSARVGQFDPQTVRMVFELKQNVTPQLFALAREYADSSAREVVMFSSVMRAQLSLAWVIGPPLAFMLALNYGFTMMFAIAAGIFAISLAMIALMLPSVARIEQAADVEITQVSGWNDPNVRMLFIASTLMWTCNTMYIIDMPLWISSDLGLPDKLAGILMGTAAGLEIPAMILAGYYVKRFGKRRMMIAAVAAGVLFYLGLIFFHSRTALLVLQLFNAVFIGIIAGIGMLWFQDLMPGRAGSATTLFTNSISTGVILAGVIQGAVAQSYGHYAVYWVIAVISVVTLWMTGRVKDV